MIHQQPEPVAMHPRKDFSPFTEPINENSVADTGDGESADLLPQDCTTLDTESRNRERASQSSSPVEFLWSSVYSSDEEDQMIPQRLSQRCYSDPLSEDISSPSCEPRWRTRSSEVDEECLFYVDTADLDIEKERHRSARPKNVYISFRRSIFMCKPAKLLYALIVISCFTTFWLPYPDVRPEIKQLPKVRSLHTPGLRRQSQEAVVASMHHGRAAPELEMVYRPGLEQYYKQEGFASHAWTKYTDMGALGVVIIWAVLERNRREAPSA